MARKRASWSWVEGYPVFIYTTWVYHKVFRVDILIGVKGNQNAPGYGPRDKPYHSYTQTTLASKHDVVQQALAVARLLITKTKKEINGGEIRR